MVHAHCSALIPAVSSSAAVLLDLALQECSEFLCAAAAGCGALCIQLFAITVAAHDLPDIAVEAGECR